MKLKCIGGPNDGELFDVGNRRLHDHINIPRKEQLSISPMTLGSIEPTALRYDVYVITCFHHSKDNVYYFLRPDDWSNEQAIEHQFSK